jgi:hypothetical protein
MVVAILALFFALGGTGYAASTLVQGSSSATANSSPFAACRENVYEAFRFKSSGSQGQRAAATQAICGSSSTISPGGPAGPQGEKGATGPTGQQGDVGATGATGSSGATGPIGPAAYAEFFALMPPDNAATVAPGTAVAFPQNGPGGGAIARTGPSTFLLPDVGTYRVAFGVSVTEAGQLGLTLNAAELAYAVYGRATGTSQITGEALVQTTAPNSLLSVVNPAGNSTALTITPLAGGTHPVSASLVIEQLG